MFSDAVLWKLTQTRNALSTWHEETSKNSVTSLAKLLTSVHVYYYYRTESET